GGVSFSEVMGKQKDEQAREQLKEGMIKIEEQGKKLSETRTQEELQKYVAAVATFALQAGFLGPNLEERRGFNRRGKEEIGKISGEVYLKLLDLKKAVRAKEKKGLDILNMVGEIKGTLERVYA
uniref:Designed Wnt agonist B12 n=1 Tax=synthetic construct TaxID=32630 RepID=UPI000A1C7A4B|nr:Chain C, Designed Wnt agonist B12 [synthetic construct]5UN5_D Chain D, Designed Wnt agonist B12 [synthetic construct]5UN6_E Chain E, Designed Wnt agonist B12 [synthetic construct]5UN6_F Chain F, Designed Wnt agonist B12 [synthetic construct]5UN6_G Chain G, Designed Wnt agonist B12 [synthetic construct]5UN6_H Chain H, Designed Wnt agonist B12 [synthetic construct]